MKKLKLSENNFSDKLNNLLIQDEDIIIIEDFIEQNICTNSIKESHKLMKKLPNRVNVDGVFSTMDVLPTGVETERVFRSLVITNYKKLSSLNLIYEKMLKFQIDFIIEKNIDFGDKSRKFQILHYPSGGGFFDWHLHPRLPVNYGLILNLSKKNLNFNSGGTEIICTNGKTINVEDYSDIGDLILFKYDLKHRVSHCDPSKDLIFDINGRWTAVMPIY